MYSIKSMQIPIRAWYHLESILRELVKNIPTHRMMIETDSPYLVPRDIRPKPKSRRNEPKYLPHIAEVVAGLIEKPVNELIQETSQTTKQFFGV